jgi:hypothetical protein
MSLELIVGTHNILATHMTISLLLWYSTATALGGCYEATELLGGSLGFKRPQLRMQESKETNSMASDAS